MCRKPLTSSEAGNSVFYYMGLVRKVLQHAARYSYVKHIPEFPKVGVEDRPRGWFNVGEYKQITKISKKFAGKRIEWRFHGEKEEESYFCEVGGKLGPNDRLIKRYQMTKDLSDLIVFMVNSYIRLFDDNYLGRLTTRSCPCTPVA